MQELSGVPNQIDVRDLISHGSTAEHAARANEYFTRLPADSKLLRKPFFGIQDAPHYLYGAAEAITRLKLFPGAVVLDFGAGMGWLSKGFAFLDCRAIAVDVSATALQAGRAAFDADPLARGLSVDWRQFDGVRLPVDDESVDRILCYDSFHHVPDQAAILQEFHRVLRSGGRAVFHEPGPTHSQQVTSQMEMRVHGVIENDIVLETIQAVAGQIGFSNLTVALAAPVTPSWDLETYSRVIDGEPTGEDHARLLAAVREANFNLRIFSLDKGQQVEDSRNGVGLLGDIQVSLTRRNGGRMQGRAQVTNIGTVRWRASVFEAGGVFLGVKLTDPLVSGDFARIWLSSDGVEPGQTVVVNFDIQAPQRLPAEAKFDLVAEHVRWFEEVGTKPVIIRFE